MKKSILLAILFSVTGLTHALEPLIDSELQQVEGQAGADLSLKLSLNHRPLEDTQLQLTDSALLADLGLTKLDNLFDCGGSAAKFCRMALSFNKRFVSGTSTEVSDPTITAPANRLWIALKGIQGTVNVQLLGLDGVRLNEILGGGKYANDPLKAAVQFGMKASRPVQIRQFGFDALAIEKDSFTTYLDGSGRLVESATATGYGFFNDGRYVASGASGNNVNTTSVFDHGRETGFVGMKMHGNLALQGKFLMYSCAPTATARC